MNKKVVFTAFIFLMFSVAGSIFAESGWDLRNAAECRAYLASQARQSALRRNNKNDAAEVLEMAIRVQNDFE